MELKRLHLIIATVLAVSSWSLIVGTFSHIVCIFLAFLVGVLCAGITLLWVVTTTSTHGFLYDKRPHRSSSGGRLWFTLPQRWETERGELKKRLDYRTFPVYPEFLEVSQGADALLELVIRDFVTSWYSSISKKPHFQHEIDRTVRTALGSILNRILEVDFIDLVVSKLIPILTLHLHNFDLAEQAVRGKKLSKGVTESDELDRAIAAKFCGGRLHKAASLSQADTKLAEQSHLRSILTRLLPRLLPARMIQSAAVNVLVRELVACAILQPILNLLSQPDFWNQQIEAYGQSIMQERKTVRRLRAALDEHASNSTSTVSTATIPRLAPGDSERRFERYIRAINKCNNLSDARRFRSETAAELRKGSELQEPDQVYLRRLERGKRALDQKIALMATSSASRSSQRNAPSTTSVPAHGRLDNAALRDLLYNSAGLSSFMEYMDRKEVMSLVQFWIIVDGIRNPLDADVDMSADLIMAWTETDRADISQIKDAYMDLPIIGASEESRAAVAHFLQAGRDASPSQYLEARRAVLRTQVQVYETMVEHYFPPFKRTELWYKWLASDEATALAQTTVHEAPKEGSSNENVPIAQVEAQGHPQKPIRPTKLLPRLSTSNAVRKQHPDLRRAVVSSSDIKGILRSSGSDDSPRRSLDGNGQRNALFDDDDSEDILAQSIQSLDSEQDVQRAPQHDQGVVDAMQAALTDIMEQPDLSHKADVEDDFVTDTHFTESSGLLRSNSPALNTGSESAKPSLASLGLIGAQSTSRFLDDGLFEDEQKFVEDERDDIDTSIISATDDIHEAAPGDLGLAEAIDALTGDIAKLVTQDSIVDSLTNKAELTNNTAELRILRKSKASLQREISRKELQRQQYIVQESDNSLYGRASVTIQSIMVGQESDGKEFATYVVEVRRAAGEQMPAAAWVVARRYSEFHDLNKKLRSKFPIVRKFEFPSRQVVFKLQKDFLQKRKVGLETYLRNLLRVPAICRSLELRAFLSQQAIQPVRNGDTDLQGDTQDFVTRIYNSVTDGMEEFLGNIPVLDQLSVAGQNLISAATVQFNTAQTRPNVPPALSVSEPAPADYQQAAEAEAELRAFETRELEPFVKPICDLFLEAFELNRESNWLRGRAVVVVLHQLLGGTVERKARELGQTHLSDDAVARYLVQAREMMWPDGQQRPAAKERTLSEKSRSRKEAGLALAALVPELVGSVVGRTNANSASRRFLAVLNNRRLNVHLVYTILDELLKAIFDERKP